MRKYKDLFSKITDIENLFSAWEELKHGKGTRSDVLEFEMDLEPNIFKLHRELKEVTYRHGPYSGFFITDPKRRHVHKASVRDRILHHSVFGILYPIFEPTFISASFSCQIGKGSHRGVEMVSKMLRKESRNSSRPCYALKCDIQKFFDNIDHNILVNLLERRIGDKRVMTLLRELVGSYADETEFRRESSGASSRRGMPIGNLTSQLFANVYMNEFDNFVKHVLKVKYYARYTDDFVVVSHDRKYLCDLIPIFQDFLEKCLILRIHPPQNLYSQIQHWY